MVMKKRALVPVYLLLILGVLMILLPLYITIITSFKTAGENMESFFTLPSTLYLENYKQILINPKFYRALGNTVLITVCVLVGNALIMPMTSYAISRSMDQSKLYKGLYYFLLLGIFIPFQVRMMPLVKILSAMRMLNTTGIIVVYLAYATCESVFLYVGYLATIPRDMEESAYIDGATTRQTFLYMVLPMMRPMMATVLIREGLGIWNDFMLPLVTLNRSWKYHTLTIFQYNFQSEFTINYGLSFACFVMSSLPIVLFYVFMQKSIIGGLTSGAVK